MRNIILAATFLIAYPFTDSAQRLPDGDTTAIAAASKAPPALNGALQRGFHVVTSFAAVSGLTGWVLQASDGTYKIFYSTLDGNTMIAGNLVASSGEDLTARDTAQYVPKPDLSVLWATSEASSFVAAGALTNPKAVIYVVMDPNCIYCHLLWIALKPYEVAGLQVRWIPVGFLHQDSAAKAAALLKGGEAVFTQMQEAFNEQTESGGVAGIEITPDLKAKLDANLRLMHEANVRGTPAIFYKDTSGHAQRKQGVPRLSELSGITGMPEQPESDPKLTHYGKLTGTVPK
jgi:thiol:disulfide interchange protein DsbG